MPRSPQEEVMRHAARVRQAWTGISNWRPGVGGREAAISFGRCPLRVAIVDPAKAVEPRTELTLDACREELQKCVARWPREAPRLAVAGDTGLGKTTFAVELCLRHASGNLGIEGALLYVVHDRQRVREIVTTLRVRAAGEGVPSELFADLLGRQAVYPERGEDWETVRFGCKASARAHRAGSRGRRVQMEVCKACTLKGECNARGFLGHTKVALQAQVVVTTVAKLSDVPDALWKKTAAVICDEDVLAGLLREVTVTYGDLNRARRWIRRQVGLARKRPAVKALRALLPLIDGACQALDRTHPPEKPLLVMHLPEACERFATADGYADLLAGLPRRALRKRGGVREWRYDSKAPAPWERGSPGRFPRQVWGRFLSAATADLRSGHAERNATIEIVGARSKSRRARLRVTRFDRRTVEHLRARPLLLLDATLHPAVAHVLGCEIQELRYDQRRTIVQALCPLGRLQDLSSEAGGLRSLTASGRHLVAQIAAFICGRQGYVLCRPGIADLLRREASEYDELRRTDFVTVKRERGWDARSGASVFVVLGRYAKNADACLREARALRALSMEIFGTVAALEVIRAPRSSMVLLGRGRPVTWRGEPVERVSRQLSDPLAAALQDADRVATVRQFLGRDRSGHAEVLLLRGDPTVASDGLYDARELPAAVPARLVRQVGGRSAV